MRISDWRSDVCSSDLLQNGIGELSRKEYESSVERAIDVTINFDPKLVSQAAKLGKSYAEICKGTKASQPWTQLMRLVLDGAEEAQNVVPAAKGKSGGSLLGKLGGIGNLVTKKTAKQA